MAGDTTSKKSNYISRVLSTVQSLLKNVTELEALTLEGQALAYVQAPGGPAGTLVDADFQGANSYMNAQTFANGMSTLAQLDQQLHANNAAILANLFTMGS